MEVRRNSLVLALHFGTMYSRCGFSNRGGFEQYPLDIKFLTYIRNDNLYDNKTSLCLLLNKNAEFLCYGYRAEKKFVQLTEMGETDDYFYFDKFIETLDSKIISKDTMLADVAGKSLPANHVFKIFIGACCNDLNRALDQIGWNVIPNDEIKWVIAVSTDLNNNAEQFLVSCAEQTGIPSAQLILVREASAAFVYRKFLLAETENKQMLDGTECMIVNLRGEMPNRKTHRCVNETQQLPERQSGFVSDVTVIKKSTNRLIETCRTAGNDNDGPLVNESFFKLLEDVFGKQVIEDFRRNEPDEEAAMEVAFEQKTRKYTNIRQLFYEDGKIYFKIPHCLMKNCVEDLNTTFENTKYAGKINADLEQEKLRMKINVISDLVKPTVDKITSQIENFLTGYRHPCGIMEILIIGDCMYCTLVGEAVQEKFPEKKIIYPERHAEAFIFGAVLFGHEPYEYIRNPSSEEMSESILSKLSQLKSDDFKDLVALGTFASFENRVFLAGPCNIGKSSLASILIDEPIQKNWVSTDGLIIHFGRNGIDLQKRKMVPLKKGSGDVLTKLLLGHPELKVSNEQLNATQIKKNDDGKIEEDRKASLLEINKKENKSTKPINTDKFTPQHQLRQSMSTSNKNPPVGRQKLTFSKPILETKRTLRKRSVFTAKSIQDDVLNKIKNKSYMMDIAPSDLVDFGGQKSFDMTHQLFIQHRGTFILMFDGRKGLRTELDEYPQGDVTAASILEHWINSILTYSNKSDDKMPRIVFAATHSDNFSEDEKEKLAITFKKELTGMFCLHKLHEHIMYDQIFFINATDAADLHIDHLKDVLVDIAFQQSTWGQRMPVVWVPLELQISQLRADGVKLITKERLLEINKSNNELALSLKRVEDFLLVQHSLGKLLYFDDLPLRTFVVIQPTAMVNILRAFVTDIIFWPKKGPIRHILENLSSTGVIKKKDLFILWSQQAFKDILTDDKTKEYMVQVLLHLDILVEPKRYNETDEAVNAFLVPCIVKEKIPHSIQGNATDDRTICISYHLKETVVPSALSFKFIGASISIWPLKKVEGRFCLYFQAAIMEVDSKNELQIHVKGHKIVVSLIHKVSKHLISPDLATTTQECLTLALGRILQFYRRCFGKQDYQNTSELFETEVGHVCQGETCLLSLSDAKKQANWVCKNEKTHETKLPLNWVFDKNTEHCDPKCIGLEKETLLLKPDGQHFVQLARKIGIGDFYNFFIHLGMTKNDYDNLNFRYFSNPMDFMLMGLFDWKDTADSDKSIATFDKLLKALVAIERIHYLCQVHREDHSLVEEAHRRLQDIPSDFVINNLTKKKLIGDCVVHLGVELGLSICNIKETMHNFPRNLNCQIHDLLVKWKNWKKSSNLKPTIYRLMVALKRVKAAEGLAFLKRTYNLEKDTKGKNKLP